MIFRARPAIIRRITGSMTTPSARNLSAAEFRKPHMTRWSRRDARSWTRNASSNERSGDRSTCAGAIERAAGNASSGRVADAISPGSWILGAPLRDARAGRLRRAIDARCESDEMASRAHELVLRNLHFEGVDAGLSAGSS